jgi:HK97 family phage portal protein
VRGIRALAERPRNLAPVPMTGRRLPGLFNQSAAASRAVTHQLEQMGGVGILFSIVNRTSTATACVEWKLYRKAADAKTVQYSGTSGMDERDEVTAHAALDVWRQPNPWFTGMLFRESFQQHVDLTGMAYWVISRVPRMNIPAELWCVRPDRIQPIPDQRRFIKGYVYTSPDGEQVPLDAADVIRIVVPNPTDPYSGMGAVQALMADLDASRFTSEYNRNFFLNSAEPGGVIEVEKRLSDEEFDELSMRWNEQHRGVSKAHRVAVLEQGKYVPAGYSMKDMAFPELQTCNRDRIMEAFGISNATLGITDGVNFASAKAAEAQFASLLTVPRLNRIREALNTQFLPLFGPTGKGVEFDYVSPVPQDPIDINAERDSKFAALGVAVPLGFDVPELLAALGLPPIPWEKPESMQPKPVGNPDSTADQESLGSNGSARR